MADFEMDLTLDESEFLRSIDKIESKFDDIGKSSQEASKKGSQSFSQMGAGAKTFYTIMDKVQYQFNTNIPKAIGDAKTFVVKSFSDMSKAVSKFGDNTSKVFMGVSAQSKKLSDSLRNIAKGPIGIASAGAGLLGAIGIGKAYEDYKDIGKALYEINQITGFSIASMEKWRVAMQKTGGTVDNLKDSIMTFQERSGEAARDSSSEWAKRFKDLGVDVNQKTSKVMEDTLKALSSMSNKASAWWIGNDMFGGSFEKIFPLIKNGVKELNAELSKASGKSIFSEERVAQIESFRRKILELKDSLMGWLADILPTIEGIGIAIGRTFSKIGIDFNPNKIQSSILKFIGFIQKVVLNVTQKVADIRKSFSIVKLMFDPNENTQAGAIDFYMNKLRNRIFGAISNFAYDFQNSLSEALSRIKGDGVSEKISKGMLQSLIDVATGVGYSAGERVSKGLQAIWSSPINKQLEAMNKSIQKQADKTATGIKATFGGFINELNSAWKDTADVTFSEEKDPIIQHLRLLDKEFAVTMWAGDNFIKKMSQLKDTAVPELKSTSKLTKYNTSPFTFQTSEGKDYAETEQETKDKAKTAYDVFQTLGNQMLSTWGSFSDLRDQRDQMSLDRWKSKEQQRLDSMVISSRRMAVEQKKISDEEDKRKKESYDKSKKLRLAEVAMAQGTAIANAWVGAMAIQPLPLGIALGVGTTGMLLGQMGAQMATINEAQGYADGGIIGGFKGARMGQDDTIIKARKDEGMINAQQQRFIYDVFAGKKKTAQSTPQNNIYITVEGNVTDSHLQQLKDDLGKLIYNGQLVI